MRVRELVASAAFIAERDVEITIRTKVEIAGVVINRFIVLGDKTNFRGGVTLVWILGRDLETGKDIVQTTSLRGGGVAGVENIKVAIRSVTGVKGQPE